MTNTRKERVKSIQEKTGLSYQGALNQLRKGEAETPAKDLPAVEALRWVGPMGQRPYQDRGPSEELDAELQEILGEAKPLPPEIKEAMAVSNADEILRLTAGYWPYSYNNPTRDPVFPEQAYQEAMAAQRPHAEVVWKVGNGPPPLKGRRIIAAPDLQVVLWYPLSDKEPWERCRFREPHKTLVRRAPGLVWRLQSTDNVEKRKRRGLPSDTMTTVESFYRDLIRALTICPDDYELLVFSDGEPDEKGNIQAFIGLLPEKVVVAIKPAPQEPPVWFEELADDPVSYLDRYSPAHRGITGPQD